MGLVKDIIEITVGAIVAGALLPIGIGYIANATGIPAGLQLLWNIINTFIVIGVALMFISRAIRKA